MDARGLSDEQLRMTPIRWAAREAGVSGRAFVDERHRRRIVGRRGRRPDLERRAEIRALLAQGETTAQVARALGVTAARIRQVYRTRATGRARR